MAEFIQGRVEWFDDQKGFGSIRDSEGKDHFVRYTAFRDMPLDQIREGAPVEFESQAKEGGREACNVREILR